MISPDFHMFFFFRCCSLSSRWGEGLTAGMVLMKLRNCKHKNPKWPFWKQRSKLGRKTDGDNGSTWCQIMPTSKWWRFRMFQICQPKHNSVTATASVRWYETIMNQEVWLVWLMSKKLINFGPSQADILSGKRLFYQHLSALLLI